MESKDPTSPNIASNSANPPPYRATYSSRLGVNSPRFPPVIIACLDWGIWPLAPISHPRRVLNSAQTLFYLSTSLIVVHAFSVRLSICDPSTDIRRLLPTDRQQQPAVQQKAWTGKSPITNRPANPPQANGQPVSNRASPSQLQPSQQQQQAQSVLCSIREGQRARITLTSGAEFEGVFAGATESGCNLRMVQQKKLPGGNITNGTKRDEQSQNMTFQRKDIASASLASGNARPQNGSRSGFRTDAAISNTRGGQERTLKKWEPESTDGMDMSLEGPSNSGPWDQFAENERRFGVKTDYDETMYTTAIDRSHPQYKQRLLDAEKKAREIQSTAAMTPHVAEERQMDFSSSGGDKGDEEEKYSGVRRQQDFPPLSTGGSNKYTPPARRAPAGQSNAHGVPVDPAIISSVVKGAGKKGGQAKPEDGKAPIPSPAAKTTSPAPATETKSAELSKAVPKTDSMPAESKTAESSKPADQTAIPLRPAVGTAATTATSKPTTAQTKDGVPPSATSTVERDVLNSFKSFAANQRLNAAQVRHNKAKHDKEIKLIELKKFADSFKLSTPVPNDLIGIIAKDPAKQQQIQEKALQNAADVANEKKGKDNKGALAAKEAQAKPVAPTEQTTTGPQSETRPSHRAPAGPTGASQASAAPARHAPNNRQSYGPGFQNQNFRNNQAAGHNLPQQGPRTGNLAPRLRNIEQAKMNNAPQPNHHHVQSALISAQDMRPPPTGPSNPVDFNGPRRLSGAPMGGKLNPNSHEFRPGGAAPFIPQFGSGHPSAGSSPRSSVNHMGEPPASTSPMNRGQLIRRKTQNVDIKKCNTLAFIKTAKPPPTKNWDGNDGLRPSYDTLPTWRQLQDDEKPDSTMHLTYHQHFEKQPFANPSLATPNPQHAMPLAHQHQLPFHLQQGAQHMGPRHSPHMPHMQMQSGQHPHPPHVPFSNGDDHRMVPSSSQQSFQSPRISQVPMAYPPAMNSPAQMGYNQPNMPYMGAPGTPQMNNQYRNFPNAQYGMPQQPHMGPPMMMQPPFAGGAPQGMPQMQMYPGQHPPQFMPPGGAVSQPMPGTNGYPSPGRPTAPMMAPQGSQQGQQMYGMSPGMQYQQPAYPSQQPGQGKFAKNGPPAQMRKY
ncbi:LsmAD domain-containing protein [Zalerion maritima]|uniref:LsmAD domain-containing protein n=1 Tax=Zalerion maritima TaxID=339359 RepID=A0AAD5RX78_9PEZI|nr:LsmAD domain-containing protein [Zalerion maritima]